MKLGLLLLLWVQAAAPGHANWAYITCITKSAGGYLATGPSTAEYDRHLASACGVERARLRRDVIRRQLLEGRSRAEAERGADEFFATIKTKMLDLQP
jgi:hypothetical protein